MNPRKVTDNVFFVGTPDWDRRLFDALIPLPQGTSYNAYLITGQEKTALIDTVDPTKWDVLKAYLEQIKPSTTLSSNTWNRTTADHCPWCLKSTQMLK